MPVGQLVVISACAGMLCVCLKGRLHGCCGCWYVRVTSGRQATAGCVACLWCVVRSLVGPAAINMHLAPVAHALGEQASCMQPGCRMLQSPLVKPAA